MADLLYRHRKYTLAMIFTIASIAGLFTNEIDQQGFIYLTGIILGLYGYQNIKDKEVQK